MRVAGIVVLVLCASACTSKLVRTDATPRPIATRSVGSALGNIGSSEPAETNDLGRATDAPTRFVLTVTDRNGIHPPGIPVQITGTLTATRLTDANGKVTITEPGVYRFTVATGCGANTQVFLGVTASAGVASGKPSSGVLNIDWRHRFVPAPPVFSTPGPPWPVAGSVTLQYSVIDRCANDFAPNADVSTFQVAGASSNLKVTKPPTPKSDSKHQAFMTVTCLGKGDVALRLVDRYNPKDVFDVITNSADYEPPRCG